MKTNMNPKVYTVTTRTDYEAGITATRHEFESDSEVNEFVECNAELCLSVFAKAGVWFRYPIVNGQVQWCESEECE